MYKEVANIYTYYLPRRNKIKLFQKEHNGIIFVDYKVKKQSSRGYTSPIHLSMLYPNNTYSGAEIKREYTIHHELTEHLYYKDKSGLG